MLKLLKRYQQYSIKLNIFVLFLDSEYYNNVFFKFKLNKTN